MIIDLQTHPAFAKRETEATIGRITDLEANLIKGLTANVVLVERSLERFETAPSDQSLTLIVNSARAINDLLLNLESEEPEMAYASDEFVEQYATLKLRLLNLKSKLEMTALSYRPPAPQPVQITVNVAPQKPKNSFALQAVGVAIMVTAGFFLIF